LFTFIAAVAELKKDTFQEQVIAGGRSASDQAPA